MLAKRATSIAESLTLAITAKAKKMKEEGIDVVGFGAGEPDFNTPDYINKAAVVALERGMTKYTPSAGTLALRQAICDKFSRDNGLSYSPKQIVVSNGAKQSLYNAMLAIVDPGDEVIIPAPYWLTYPELVGLCGGVVKNIFPLQENNLKITPEQLKNAISKKTKAIVLNSPSNPSGIVYSKEELGALAAVIEEAGIYVISDEIYEKLVYDGCEHHSIAAYSEKLKDRTIVINGVSKTYSMTGWRIGYLAANEQIAKAIDNIQSHTTSNANSIAQYASMIALSAEEGKQFLDTLHDTFADRRHIAAKEMDKAGIKYVMPQGAFYFMVDVSPYFSKTKTAQSFAEQLLDSQAVAVVPCESFGAPEYVRISYAMKEDGIIKGVRRMADFIKAL